MRTAQAPWWRSRAARRRGGSSDRPAARLNSTPSTMAETRMPMTTAPQNGSAESQRDQDEERRQHDELALREVDRLRGLPQQREADRDQRVDAAGREPRDEELEKSAIVCSPSSEELSAAASSGSTSGGPPTRSRGSTALIFGSSARVIICLPLTTSAMKLIAIDVALRVPRRLHQDAGLVRRRDRHAVQRGGRRAFLSNLPIFLVAYAIA